MIVDVRQTRRKRKISIDQDPATMSKKSRETNNQWIMLSPRDFLSSSEGNSKDQGPVFHRLPHPKTSQPALYAFQDKDVYEIMKFREQFRSWFVNDSIQEDGSLHILSPIDPLFLAIPFLEKVAQKGKYMTLEQILIDKEYQSGLSLLENSLPISGLHDICDCKGPDDLRAYKLDQEKFLSWLSQKVEKLAEHLKKVKMHVGSGSHAANFVKSAQNDSSSHLKATTTPEEPVSVAIERKLTDYVLYAFGLVSDYIAEDWAQQLKDNLHIVSSPAPCKPVELEPPAKKQKMNGGSNGVCTEDYRDKISVKDKEKKPLKLTAAQKQLAKVDKTGMKSMNSFFKVKPKKA